MRSVPVGQSGYTGSGSKAASPSSSPQSLRPLPPLQRLPACAKDPLPSSELPCSTSLFPCLLQKEKGTAPGPCLLIKTLIRYKLLSCRKGLLRGGRPLRGVYTGLAGYSSIGPPAGRDDRCRGPVPFDDPDKLKRRETPAPRAVGPSGRTAASS